MRSLVLCAIGGALVVSALAGGCKEEAAAPKTAAAESGSVVADSSVGQPEEQAPPVLPVPRRMRSQSADAPQQREEMRQRMMEMRQKFDANGDGQLDEGERDALRTARIQERVKRIDADGSGTISREEAQAAPFGGRMLRNFDAVDANQDQVISAEELEAAMSERQARRRERRQKRQEELQAESRGLDVDGDDLARPADRR